MKIYNSILETIGNTPVVKLNTLPGGEARKNIYVKLEYFNPGKSIKDRIAYNMINEAEKKDQIDCHSIILESSSGNTGISLSMVCRVKGYTNVIVVDQNCPQGKINLLKALGAKILVVTTERKDNVDLTQKRIKFVRKAQQMIKEIFVPNQYENKDAPMAHYKGTAREVIDFMEETGITFEALFTSVGTGGTITGVSRRIKQYNPEIKIIGVEPEGSTLFGGKEGPYFQQGPGNYFQPKNLVHDHIDLGLKVSDRHAFNMCRKVALKEGILIGGSAGGVVYKAVEMAGEFKGNILAILPDGGQKYLDNIYCDEWMKKNGIPLDKENENPMKILNIDGIEDYGELVKQIKEEVFK